MKISWFGRTGVDHRWKPAAPSFVEILPTLYFRSPSTSQSSIRLWNLLPKNVRLLRVFRVGMRFRREKRRSCAREAQFRADREWKITRTHWEAKKCPQKEIKLDSQVIHQWWWPLRLMFRDGLSLSFLHTSKFLKVTVTSGFNGLCKGSFALKHFFSRSTSCESFKKL